MRTLNYYGNILFGVKIIECPEMVNKKQRRFNKNKRINKKWIKKYGYIDIPRRDVVHDPYHNCIYGHPDTLNKMIELCNKSN